MKAIRDKPLYENWTTSHTRERDRKKREVNEPESEPRKRKKYNEP